MIKPDSLTAFVLSALLLTPLLTISTGAFDLAASDGLNSLQTPDGVKAKQILVKEQHRLLPSEKAKYSKALRLIQSGEELIQEGRGMQGTRDRRSGLDGKIVSGARTRQAGAERVAEGRLLVRKAEKNLRALARQVTERIGQAEEKMAGAQLRTWKDKDNRELRATFLSLNDDSVTVIREDRMEFTIPLATLSEKDVSYAVLASKGLAPDDSSFLKAIESSDEEVIDHIFKAGFQPSLATQKLALEASIGKQSTSALEAILSKGLDPNLLLDTGKLPLSHAVELSNLELVKMLLKFGASVLKKDTYGLLPAHYGLSNPDQRILARVVPDKADIAKSSHTVFEHILNSRLASLSSEHLQLLVKHEAGESMAPDQTATVNLIIAAQKPTVSGYLEAMSEEDRHKFLPSYRDAGLAAEANATEWEKVIDIVKQSQGLSLDELLSVGGLSNQKEIQLSLISTGYDVTAESFEKAVAAADRKAVELFLLTDISPTEKTPPGESPLFRAFATQQAELADLIISKAEVPSHEVARIRLLAEGDSLDEPLRSKLRLEADEIAFTLETFETAVENADRQLVDLFITAGAINEFNLDKDSPFWGRTWSQTNGELKKHLLDAAFNDVKLRTQVAITHVDISTLDKNAGEKKDDVTVNAVKVQKESRPLILIRSKEADQIDKQTIANLISQGNPYNQGQMSPALDAAVMSASLNEVSYAARHAGANPIAFIDVHLQSSAAIMRSPATKRSLIAYKYAEDMRKRGEADKAAVLESLAKEMNLSNMSERSADMEAIIGKRFKDIESMDVLAEGMRGQGAKSRAGAAYLRSATAAKLAHYQDPERVKLANMILNPDTTEKRQEAEDFAVALKIAGAKSLGATIEMLAKDGATVDLVRDSAAFQSIFAELSEEEQNQVLKGALMVVKNNKVEPALSSMAVASEAAPELYLNSVNAAKLAEASIYIEEFYKTYIDAGRSTKAVNKLFQPLVRFPDYFH